MTPVRSYVVFIVLVALPGLFVTLQLTREPSDHTVTVEAEHDPDEGGARRDRAASAGSADGGGAATASGSKQADGGRDGSAGGEVAAKPRMKRALRVASVGWEYLAPGVVANDGARAGKRSLFDKQRLPVELKAYKSMEEVEAALARGGEDKLGADVAIVPLPLFVAAHERLRALAPRIFFVAGWSRGHDGLMASARYSLTRLPRRVALVGRKGQPATYLSLYLLDLAGRRPGRVTLLARGSRRAGRAPFVAMERPLPRDAKTGDRRFLATTADAPRLIPIVAIAPQGLIEAHAEALSVWGNVWTSGIDRLKRDVPKAARRVAALEGAPHVLDLLKRLGQMDPASLMDNARVARLSGRSTTTLDQLFRRTWRVWRAAGVLSSPMPEQAPISVEVISSMVRTYPALVEQPPAAGAAASNTPSKGLRGDAVLTTLLVHSPRVRRWDPDVLVEELGFLAEVFGRAEVRVSVRDNYRRARALVSGARARYDLTRPERIRPVARSKGPLVRFEIRIQQ